MCQAPGRAGVQRRVSAAHGALRDGTAHHPRGQSERERGCGIAQWRLQACREAAPVTARQPGFCEPGSVRGFSVADHGTAQCRSPGQTGRGTGAHGAPAGGSLAANAGNHRSGGLERHLAGAEQRLHGPQRLEGQTREGEGVRVADGSLVCGQTGGDALADDRGAALSDQLPPCD